MIYLFLVIVLLLFRDVIVQLLNHFIEKQSSVSTEMIPQTTLIDEEEEEEEDF